MTLNWNFLGGGVQNKRPSVGGGGEYGYFLELHNIAPECKQDTCRYEKFGFLQFQPQAGQLAAGK